jgi:hypothetical protein
MCAALANVFLYIKDTIEASTFDKRFLLPLIFLVPISYLHLCTVERIPNTPHALIHTRHRLARLPVLLACVIPQKLGLFPHTVELQVLHTQCPCGSVHVMCGDDGVSPWPWADGDFDLRAILCERG